jgi:hypothetical protein
LATLAILRFRRAPLRPARLEVAASDQTQSLCGFALRLRDTLREKKLVRATHRQNAAQ